MDSQENTSVKQKLLGVINIPWFFHFYHFSLLIICLLMGYFFSWWIPVAVVAVIVAYMLKL
jgi:hypothetical protein